MVPHTVVGIWMHDEPLALAMFPGELEATDTEDHLYADVQTWITFASTLAEAESIMRATVEG